MNYRISETEDYYPISVLCSECGLEVEPSKEAPEHNLKMWKCEDKDTGELLAAAVAGYRDGCYVLEQLAVKKEYRNEHMGGKNAADRRGRIQTSRSRQDMGLCKSA